MVLTSRVGSRIKLLTTLSSLTEQAMTKSVQQFAGIILLITATAGAASAQAPRARGTAPGSVQPAPVPTGDDQNARLTRDQLHRYLSQYPPSLEKVLQLDPSLVQNPEYLAPYPALAQFLSQHPEISHNPSYFLAVG